MSTQNYHLLKLGRAHIPNAAYHVQKPIGLLISEMIFQELLPRMGVMANLVM